MWPRLILRELIPHLPRLLRLLPMVEGFFSIDRASEAASSAGHTQHLVRELQAQITEVDAVRGRQLLELESRVEAIHQELRDLKDQSNLISGNLKRLSQQARTMMLLGWVSAALAGISLVIIVVVLSRLLH